MTKNDTTECNINLRIWTDNDMNTYTKKTGENGVFYLQIKKPLEINDMHQLCIQIRENLEMNGIPAFAFLNIGERKELELNIYVLHKINANSEIPQHLARRIGYITFIADEESDAGYYKLFQVNSYLYSGSKYTQAKWESMIKEVIISL